jgi:hypothetical protein
MKPRAILPDLSITIDAPTPDTLVHALHQVAPVGGQLGQTTERQIDAAAQLRAALAVMVGTEPEELWTMRNGYALATAQGLRAAANVLQRISNSEREHLKERLEIGLHWVGDLRVVFLGAALIKIGARAERTGGVGDARQVKPLLLGLVVRHRGFLLKHAKIDAHINGEQQRGIAG